MSTNRLVGAVLLVVGIVLLALGYHASNAPLDQVSNAVTGHFSDQTTWYVILGAVGVVAGVLMLAFGRTSRV